MRNATTVILIVMLGACSTEEDSNVSPDSGSQPDAAAASDVQQADSSASADTSADVDDSFCARADCPEDQPQCSELLQRCVECTANADCTTAPLFACETVGTDGEDPSFACVECVDDTVCAGGTCDLATFTCML